MSNAINEIDDAIDKFYNSERRLLMNTLERQKDSIREAALNEVKSAEICLKDEDYAGSAFHIMMHIEITTGLWSGKIFNVVQARDKQTAMMVA
jgi:uncharacterized protein YtpQ (UPF0354 family)